MRGACCASRAVGPRSISAPARAWRKRRVERMRPAHGVDGLNGSGFSQRWKLPELERGHSANFLAFAARRKHQRPVPGAADQPGQGLLEDPAAFRDWRPTIMAGAFAVEGKAAGGADFNSWSDPEALQRVLEAGSCRA
jgi:hypothetical protein